MVTVRCLAANSCTKGVLTQCHALVSGQAGGIQSNQADVDWSVQLAFNWLPAPSITSAKKRKQKAKCVSFSLGMDFVTVGWIAMAQSLSSIKDCVLFVSALTSLPYCPASPFWLPVAIYYLFGPILLHLISMVSINHENWPQSARPSSFFFFVFVFGVVLFVRLTDWLIDWFVLYIYHFGRLFGLE